MQLSGATCRWSTSTSRLRPFLSKPTASSTTLGYRAHLTRTAAVAAPPTPSVTREPRAWVSTSSPRQAKNQIYAPIRNADSFATYLSLSSSSRTPLLTLWTASWCSTCRVVAPMIRSLVESGVGESHGGVAFTTVEFDSPDIMSGSPNLALDYMITSIPTLLSFDAGEAQTSTKVADARRLADRQFLIDWINTEASRHGGGGSGGGSAFGGLFGK
ncbi:Fc.00g040000.m01.CDS01 [Cosmosporella sp. VM-42]